jgi:hypothetical protein
VLFSVPKPLLSLWAPVPYDAQAVPQKKFKEPEQLPVPMLTSSHAIKYIIFNCQHIQHSREGTLKHYWKLAWSRIFYLSGGSHPSFLWHRNVCEAGA